MTQTSAELLILALSWTLGMSAQTALDQVLTVNGNRRNSSSAPGNAPRDADLAGCAAEGEEEEFRISRGGRRVGASASLDPPDNGVATFGETNLGKCNILHIRHRLSGAQKSLPFARHTP